ncbi:hypothetical protein [Shouchella miscanthi]|uniref:Uncharacterized protein n=1 Tax=Shouchella miscanthi TaxID=2598861 RepID=A0ABU6NR77_9BACI|nr:hypothetical protein [Shouchella miscanthi]
MNDKIPSSQVGAKIVEWYSCILSSSYKIAYNAKLKPEMIGDGQG